MMKQHPIHLEIEIMNINTLIKELELNKHDQKLVNLYLDPHQLDYQRNRYVNALKKYQSLYDDTDIKVISVSGRSEVSGNHTDHQHGRVLAAALNLDGIAIVSKSNEVHIVSDDLNVKKILIDDLEKRDNEEGTTESLVRGVLYKLKEEGYKIGGFNAYITSDVLVGSGLSSSAFFEDMIGMIINTLYNDNKIDLVEIAKIAQYAENVYFNKPCGLMDQCACIVGGLISIDFKDPSTPIVEAIDVDFSSFHHSLCIIDVKADHADLTDEYAAVPREMKEIANYFNKEVLRDVDEEEFYHSIASLREECGDRQVLRAYHFFNENNRVLEIVDALKNKDFESFKKGIKASGDSSYKYLQNVYPSSHPYNQAISIALSMSEHILKDNGVVRVHGGGFAGTIQAFVKDDYVDTYKKEIEKIFGKNTCHVLKIRNKGGCVVF